MWQTIETAPKDGTTFDAWADGERFTDCCWAESSTSRYRSGWWCEQFDNHEGDWFETAGVPQPTHWMPLPEPPQMTWQPIDSAPKDRHILAWSREEGAVRAFWGSYFKDQAPHWCLLHLVEIDESSFVDVSDDLTHWRLLPEPPQ